MRSLLINTFYVLCGAALIGQHETPNDNNVYLITCGNEMHEIKNLLMQKKLVCVSIRQIALVSLTNKVQISTKMQIQTHLQKLFFVINTIIQKEKHISKNTVIKT